MINSELDAIYQGLDEVTRRRLKAAALEERRCVLEVMGECVALGVVRLHEKQRLSETLEDSKRASAPMVAGVGR